MKKQELTNRPKLTKEESDIYHFVEDSFDTAKNRGDLEVRWDDEIKAYTGDHWDLSFSKRSADSKRKHPNSVDNYIFPSVLYKINTLTATIPVSVITSTEVIEDTDETEGTTIEDINEDEQRAKQLTQMVDSVMYKNVYKRTYEEIVRQGVCHGPFIAQVIWDNDWIGGTGGNRWIGDIKIENVPKEDFYCDPSIKDLAHNLEECEFIIIKKRKKVEALKKMFGKVANVIIETAENSVSDFDEGSDPKMTNLYCCWHKGKPRMVSKKWKEIFEAKAENEEDEFKKMEYLDMANGDVDGLHLAYTSDNGVFLDYIPYVYDDGLYPFAFETCYDDGSQLGFGEIMQIMVPQVLHNMVDEVEIGAMVRTGLGGYMYNKGSIDRNQRIKIEQNSHKPGVLLEVNNITGVKERTGVAVPSTIENYKMAKKEAIDSISGYTQTLQGLTKSGTPYSTVQELGQRADIRTVGVAKKISLLQQKITHLVVNRAAQFYTEPRKHRIVIEGDKTAYKEFDNQFMFKEWERDTEEGPKMEKYLPEFDIKVVILNEKPSNRDYYVELAFRLVEGGLLDNTSLYETIEDGKIPSLDVIKQRMQANQQQSQKQTETVQEMLSQLPVEVQEEISKLSDEEMQQVSQMTPEELDQFVNELMQATEETESQV